MSFVVDQHLRGWFFESSAFPRTGSLEPIEDLAPRVVPCQSLGCVVGDHRKHAVVVGPGDRTNLVDGSKWIFRRFDPICDLIGWYDLNQIAFDTFDACVLFEHADRRFTQFAPLADYGATERLPFTWTRSEYGNDRNVYPLDFRPIGTLETAIPAVEYTRRAAPRTRIPIHGCNSLSAPESNCNDRGDFSYFGTCGDFPIETLSSRRLNGSVCAMVRIMLTDDDRAIAVFDPIENAYMRLWFPTPISSCPITTNPFSEPVDHAIVLNTSAVRLETAPSVSIRDDAGKTVTGGRIRQQTLPQDRYQLTLDTPIRTHLVVRSSISIDVTNDPNRRFCTTIAFGDSTKVRLGFRGLTVTPESKIQVSRNPGDLIAGVSSFGSAIDVTGANRSYPALRKHPPLLEVGDELSIPETVRSPPTAVCLRVPETTSHAIVAAPLAYYLGAALEPGQDPALIVDGQPLWSMHDRSSYPQACEELLHHVLFLDCLGRDPPEDGTTVAARQRVRDHLPFDPSDVAHAPNAERLRTYCSIAPATIREFVPNWDQPAVVVPNARTVESLPYLAYDLRSIRPLRIGGDRQMHRMVERSSIGSVGDARQSAHPVGMTEAFPAGFRHRHRRDGTNDQIGIGIVCNVEAMTAELEAVQDVYSSREAFPVDVDRYKELSTDELASVLRKPFDFLHYIGHLDDAGLRCIDGHLDVRMLPGVAVETFFLNACTSADQAAALVRAGAVGGIATTDAVVNSGAVRIGETVARLLIAGFPIRTALALAREVSVIGGSYRIVGDPTVAIANNHSGIPYRCHIEECGRDTYRLTIETFLTSRAPKGSLCSFHLGPDVPFFLTPTNATFDVDRATLREFLSLEDVPVRIATRDTWSHALLCELD